MSPSPQVTICVPAYQSAGLVEKALTSCQRQTWEGVRVLVSVDKGDDDTGAVCERFAARDSRFAVHLQQERLGWVRNVNYLLDRVETEFFFVLFHDDFLDPTYTQILVERLLSAPGAVICCSDLQFFGTRDGRRCFYELTGSRYERISTFLADRFFAPMRAMTRSMALQNGIRLREYDYESYKTGGIYMLELMNLGECHRIPEPLYSKALRAGSVTAGWGSWPFDRKLAAECMYTLNALWCVESLDLNQTERDAASAILIGQLMIWFSRAQTLRSSNSRGAGPQVLAASALLSHALHQRALAAESYAVLADSTQFKEVCDKLGQLSQQKV